MKKLLVDIGNTRIKWSLKEGDGWDQQKMFAWHKTDLDAELDLNWGNIKMPESILVSNVAGAVVREIMARWCEIHWKIVPHFAQVKDFEHGVTNSYPQPERLGIDRWLAMLAAWDLRKKNVCVIDCGSAITIDVIDVKGSHLGGMIAPGLALSGRALTDHTHALTADQRKNFPLFANNTEDAISSGCYHQFIGGIQHVIEKVRQQTDPDMEYIITGGDAELVLTALDIEMSHEPYLILKGLLLSAT